MAMVSNGLSQAGKRIVQAGLVYQQSHKPPRLPVIVARPKPVEVPLEPPVQIRTKESRQTIELAHERARREAARIEREREAFHRRTVKVQQILGAVLPPVVFNEFGPAPFITRPKQIIADALVIFALTRRDFFSKRRAKLLVVARHYAAQRIKDECELSLPRVARAVGYGDHTTVLHALTPMCRARVAAWLAGKGAK